MTVVCDKGDVAIVPFPFTDLGKAKTRPALSLSTAAVNQQSGQTIFAMITTAAHSRWPTDVALTDLAACGLAKPSVVRFKLFTLDNRLIARRIGRLGDKDRRAVQQVMRAVLAV
jgi:mRNA-degrading endonuclease toxin of MazEF toxin-antitoxin module